MRKLIALLLLLPYFLSACATDMHKQFDKVKVGMDKNDVLGLLDSPQRTQRWHGMDRWTYIFYENDNRLEKEVHFSEGVANYVGDLYKPEITAEEQDSRNESANKDVEVFAQTHREELKKSFQDFEQRSHGQDSIRYVPQFTPVQ